MQALKMTEEQIQFVNFEFGNAGISDSPGRKDFEEKGQKKPTRWTTTRRKEQMMITFATISVIGFILSVTMLVMISHQQKALSDAQEQLEINKKQLNHITEQLNRSPQEYHHKGSQELEPMRMNISEAIREIRTNLEAQVSGLNKSQQISHHKGYEELEFVKNNLSAAIKDVREDAVKRSYNMTKMLQSQLGTLTAYVYLDMTWERSSATLVYKVFKETVTYKTAESRCKQLGARLAAKIMRDPGAASNMASKSYLPGYTWIGYTDEQTEGTWKWSDGGATNTQVTKWWRGRPDNAGGLEDHAHIRYIADGKFFINDNQGRRRFSFLCEKDLVPVLPPN